MGDHEGHRKRLRTKFLAAGFSGFLDYEVIELLLTLGIPRKDCKPIAKELIKKYRTVNNIINAREGELRQIKGLGEVSVFGIKLAKEIIIYSKKENLLSSEGLEINFSDIADLAIKEIGYSSQEVFKVYCLNAKGRVGSGVVSVGVLDSSIIHPRELFKIAIENNAASVIVAHNHPSGDLHPSEDDIYTTRKLAEAGKILGIKLDDHIIVSNQGYISLAEQGYL